MFQNGKKKEEASEKNTLVNALYENNASILSHKENVR